ncbi:MAG TPA: sigma-70 family RNA polymerase sigma factor [Candidatus Acidoferrum sp.]|nr:sigma-70 family RNA polymerase sigma factor [Candidatus Acidoferrum sp.]
MTAARHGDSEAFEQLCQPCMSKIRRTAYRITRNREDAEDAAQDSLLRAFVNMKNFNGGSTFSTWLTRIVINSSLMIIRKRRNSPEISAVDEIGSEGNERVWNIPDAGPSPEADFSQRERQEILLGVINAMKPTRRRVIELQHLQELSLKETAMALGVSVVVAKSRLFHARTALRKSSALRAIAKSRSEYAA